jgi:hypothetical protein
VCVCVCVCVWAPGGGGDACWVCFRHSTLNLGVAVGSQGRGFASACKTLAPGGTRLGLCCVMQLACASCADINVDICALHWLDVCSSQNCYTVFSLTLPHCTALHITYLSECCSHSNRVSVFRPHRSLTVDPHTDTHSTQAVILTHFTSLTHHDTLILCSASTHNPDHDTLILYSVHSLVALQADHCMLTADTSTHVYPQLLD